MKIIIIDKQNELKSWIKKIGLTQKYFAELYCVHYYHDPHESDIKRFYEKFKKEVTRETTDISILDKYLQFLFTLDEFKDVGYVKPDFYDEDKFTDNFNKRMKKISKSITENF